MDYVTLNERAHRLGRIWMGAAIIMMLAVPVCCGIITKSSVDWEAFFSVGVFWTLILLYVPTAIGEIFLYSNMIGTDGMYLAFVTGNLSNLKIPCVVNAREIVGAPLGSEENDVASTISIAVSSILTVVIIAIGIVLLKVSGLSDYLQNAEYMKSAFGTVVFALFGALGGKYLVKYPKIALIPALLLLVLSLFMASSILLFVSVIACVYTAYKLYYNNIKAEDSANNLRKAYGYSEIEQKELIPEEKTNLEKEDLL